MRENRGVGVFAIEGLGSKPPALPLLEKLLRHFVVDVEELIGSSVHSNSEAKFVEMALVKRSEYQRSLSFPAAAVTCKDKGDRSGLVMIQRDLIYALVELLLGGRQCSADLDVESRPFTKIEQSLVLDTLRPILDLLCEKLSSVISIRSLKPVDFLESASDYHSDDSQDLCVLLRILIRIEKGAGVIDILLPYTLFRESESVLKKPYDNSLLPRNQEWRKALVTCILDMDIKMRVELGEMAVTIGKIQEWQVGDVLLTNTKPDGEVRVCSSGVEIAKGVVGKLGDYVAVKLIDSDNDQ